MYIEKFGFKKLESIEDFNIYFKYFEDHKNDGYQATFYLYKKENEETFYKYKVDFVIGDTQYNCDINNSKKSVKEYIDEKYSNIEKCFKNISYEYLVKMVSTNKLKNETVDFYELIHKHI